MKNLLGHHCLRARGFDHRGKSSDISFAPGHHPPVAALHLKRVPPGYVAPGRIETVALLSLIGLPFGVWRSRGESGLVVIPVHDVNPVRRTPLVTYVLIAVNIVVFLLTPVAAGSVGGGTTLAQTCRLQAYLDHYGAIPVELMHNRQLTLVPDGRVVVSPRGPGCTLRKPSYRKLPVLSAITSQFLHGSWLHLLGNMLFLWIFGNNVEDRFGHLRYLLFYLGCGMVAAYGFAAANPNSTEVLIGASGAIAGVLGAYIALFPRARVWSLVPVLFFIPLRLPAWLVLGGWFLLQWLYASGRLVATGGSVAYLAHVFGFIAGLLVGLFARRGQPGVAAEPLSRPRR
jgi:membrane associated rhomboid family serine protease